MAEVISRTALSASAYPMDTYSQSRYGQTDAIKQIEEARMRRQMKFPSLVGYSDFSSFRNPQKPSDVAFKRWNEKGDHSAPGPSRACDNIIDPVSGFVSAAGDVERKTGETHIPSMVDFNLTPQSNTPQSIHSVRLHCKSAPPDLRRLSEKDSGSPYKWNSRKMLDASIRAGLGGWTSDYPDQKTGATIQSGLRNSAEDTEKLLRDKLAHKYIYTPTTQRAYEEVPWDDTLKPMRWAPITTLEEKPDQVSYVFNRNRYDPAHSEWQQAAPSWERAQSRRTTYKTNAPVPGTVFCSPCPRGGQIPLYGGCIGARNIEEIDNAGNTFTPLTMKRVEIPRPTETAHRPNIPGYAGCTLYRSEYNQSYCEDKPERPTTTATCYRTMPVTPNNSEYRRNGSMSRLVTTVPPCNPYTQKDRADVVLQPHYSGN